VKGHFLYARRLLRKRMLQEWSGQRWVYLGKNAEHREALIGLLGEKALVPLGCRLHMIAEKLRQPFLDFIAELGRIQEDQLGWWSSFCSWKSSTASDLFLLICYEHLVGQLLHEREEVESPLLVVIEDPWLFCQLADAYARMPGIEFRGVVALRLLRIKASVRGVAARTRLAVRLVKNYLKQVWFWKWTKCNEPSEASIALYSYPQRPTIGGADGWNDQHSYFDDLDHLLSEAGYSVCRFSPPHVKGFERALAQRSSYFKPLILYATPLRILKAMMLSWHTFRPMGSELCGLPVRWLLLRELWQDRGRASSFLHRVFFECVNRLLDVERLKLLIYPYENYPWEKMLVLAARAHNVRTLGYQHGGGLARFMLSYFHGHGEVEWAPLPDLIVTSGPYSHELLATGGMPSTRLVMGGSLRYQYLGSDGETSPLPQRGTPMRILVALPIERDLVQHLINTLRRAFPDGGRHDGIEFLIKPHPTYPYPLTKKSFRWPATIVGGSFKKAVQTCMCVLYSGTSTGLEGLAMSRRVIRYRPELLLDTDRTDFLTKDDVVDCTDDDLRTKVLSVLHEGGQERPCMTVSQDLLNNAFSPVDTTVWLQAVHQLCEGTGQG